MLTTQVRNKRADICWDFAACSWICIVSNNHTICILISAFFIISIAFLTYQTPHLVVFGISMTCDAGLTNAYFKLSIIIIDSKKKRLSNNRAPAQNKWFPLQQFFLLFISPKLVGWNKDSVIVMLFYALVATSEPIWLKMTVIANWPDWVFFFFLQLSVFLSS